MRGTRYYDPTAATSRTTNDARQSWSWNWTEIFLIDCLFHMLTINSHTVRFSDRRYHCCKLQSIIPSTVANIDMHLTKSDEFLDEIINYYESDVLASRSAVAGEYERWHYTWKETPPNSRPTNVIDTLAKCNVTFYPNFNNLLRIFAILPVSIATPQWTSNGFRRLQSCLRSTISEERLNGLVHLSINRYIRVPLDMNAIIDELSNDRDVWRFCCDNKKR